MQTVYLSSPLPEVSSLSPYLVHVICDVNVKSEHLDFIRDVNLVILSVWHSEDAEKLAEMVGDRRIFLRIFDDFASLDSLLEKADQVEVDDVLTNYLSCEYERVKKLYLSDSGSWDVFATCFPNVETLKIAETYWTANGEEKVHDQIEGLLCFGNMTKLRVQSIYEERTIHMLMEKSKVRHIQMSWDDSKLDFAAISRTYPDLVIDVKNKRVVGKQTVTLLGKSKLDLLDDLKERNLHHLWFSVVEAFCRRALADDSEQQTLESNLLISFDLIEEIFEVDTERYFSTPFDLVISKSEQGINISFKNSVFVEIHEDSLAVDEVCVHSDHAQVTSKEYKSFEELVKGTIEALNKIY